MPYPFLIRLKQWSKNRQREVLPSTAHIRPPLLSGSPPTRKKLVASFQNLVRGPGSGWGPASGRDSRLRHTTCLTGPLTASGAS